MTVFDIEYLAATILLSVESSIKNFSALFIHIRVEFEAVVGFMIQRLANELQTKLENVTTEAKNEIIGDFLAE